MHILQNVHFTPSPMHTWFGMAYYVQVKNFVKILRDFLAVTLATLLVLCAVPVWRSGHGGSHVAAAAESDSRAEFSEYYLTNDGYVTSVKLQNPWGSCWAFAIAAALESSILKAEEHLVDGTPAGKLAAASAAADASVYEEPQLRNLTDKVNVSERAIAWFAQEPQTEKTGGSQAGEGYKRLNAKDPLTQLSNGNFSIIESALVNGQSLVSESAAPYQYNGYESGSEPWYGLDDTNGDARTKDWSLKNSLRTNQDLGWRVKNIVKLKSPAVSEYNSENGTAVYQGYDANATRAIKRALVDIGAVAIALEADVSIPEDLASGSTPPGDHFSYSNWCQYNAETNISTNHAVTIVGWDDSYSASNFGGKMSKQPPGNGAWLCKNEWGSDDLYSALGGSGDATHWGIPQDGSATGFFWLSYYDHSIESPTVFEVAPTADAYENTYIYDYLGSSEFVVPSSYEQTVEVANVFKTSSPELLRAVTAETFGPNETVSIQVRSLGVEGNSEPAENAEAAEADASSSDASESSKEGTDQNAKPIVVSEEVLLGQEEEPSKDGSFPNSVLEAEVTRTFETAGFHTIELDSPVMLSAGERFVVVEKVSTKNIGQSGVENCYLNLELAFAEAPEGVKTDAKPTVVANDGETFVMMFDNTWMSLADFNEWYKEYKKEQGQKAEVTFGNALIKAMSSNVSWNPEDRIYEMVKL